MAYLHKTCVGLLSAQFGIFISGVTSSKKKDSNGDEDESGDTEANPVSEGLLLFAIAFFYLCMMGAAYADGDTEFDSWWTGFWFAFVTTTTIGFGDVGTECNIV